METTYDNLPKQIDYLISELTEIRKVLLCNIMKPEEIPKYLDMDGALNFLQRQGYHISKSKLYKCTSSNSIPHYKRGSRLFFCTDELQGWFDGLFASLLNNDSIESIMQSTKRKISNNNNRKNEL